MFLNIGNKEVNNPPHNKPPASVDTDFHKEE